MADVVCLRPQDDFLRVGVEPPRDWDIAYRAPSDPDVPDLLSAARALVLPSAGPALSPDLFQRANALRLIQYTGAGWDRIPEAVARDLGCAVANVPGVNAQAVAEYVLLTTGLLLRKFKLADRLMWAGEFGEARTELAAERVRGFANMVVGVVGLGYIGLTVGKLFRALGAQALYFDPQPRDPAAAEAAGMLRVTLPELLERSDVVTVHVPLLPATTGLLGAAEFAQMKPGAVLVQASRGGVVDEASLLRALQDGHLAGAAVDVFTREPLPADDPIMAQPRAVADRMLLTPHIAGVTQQAAAQLYRVAWENVSRVLINGEPPQYAVL